MKTAILTSVIGAIAILLGAGVGWIGKAETDRQRDEQKWKEERYEILLRSLSGFKVRSLNAEVIDRFVQELELCWVYCPDEVIKAGNQFLNTVSVPGTECPRVLDPKELAVAELYLAIRRDTRPATGLTVRDWCLRGANRGPRQPM